MRTSGRCNFNIKIKVWIFTIKKFNSWGDFYIHSLPARIRKPINRGDRNLGLFNINFIFVLPITHYNIYYIIYIKKNNIIIKKKKNYISWYIINLIFLEYYIIIIIKKKLIKVFVQLQLWMLVVLAQHTKQSPF